MSRPKDVDQVKAVALGLGLDVDAQSFYDFYDKRGWKTGSDPITNWQSLLASWKSPKRHVVPRYENPHTHRSGFEPDAPPLVKRVAAMLNDDSRPVISQEDLDQWIVWTGIGTPSWEDGKR